MRFCSLRLPPNFATSMISSFSLWRSRRRRDHFPPFVVWGSWCLLHHACAGGARLSVFLKLYFKYFKAVSLLQHTDINVRTSRDANRGDTAAPISISTPALSERFIRNTRGTCLKAELKCYKVSFMSNCKDHFNMRINNNNKKVNKTVLSRINNCYIKHIWYNNTSLLTKYYTFGVICYVFFNIYLQHCEKQLQQPQRPALTLPKSPGSKMLSVFHLHTHWVNCTSHYTLRAAGNEQTAAVWLWTSPETSFHFQSSDKAN